MLGLLSCDALPADEVLSTKTCLAITMSTVVAASVPRQTLTHVAIPGNAIHLAPL